MLPRSIPFNSAVHCVDRLVVVECFLKLCSYGRVLSGNPAISRRESGNNLRIAASPAKLSVTCWLTSRFWELVRMNCPGWLRHVSICSFKSIRPIMYITSEMTSITGLRQGW